MPKPKSSKTYSPGVFGAVAIPTKAGNYQKGSNPSKVQPIGGNYSPTVGGPAWMGLSKYGPGAQLKAPAFQQMVPLSREEENAYLTQQMGRSKAGLEAAENRKHYQRAYGFTSATPEDFQAAQAGVQEQLDQSKLRVRIGKARGRVALHRRIGGARERVLAQQPPAPGPTQAPPAMSPTLPPAQGGPISARGGHRALLSNLVGRNR